MSTVDADWHGMGDGEDKDKPVSKGIPQSRALDHVTERPRVLVDFPYILSCPAHQTGICQPSEVGASAQSPKHSLPRS
jgi:hypothetical protein